MSSLCSTSPIPDVIRRIEENGGIVVDAAHATLDQFGGVERAYETGYRRIAVTIAEPGVARAIREAYPHTLIFAVHVTGLSFAEAEAVVAAADLVTACASGTVRQIAGKKRR